MTRNSTCSSSAFGSCHLEWGPSRLLALTLLALGTLAAGGLFASDLPLAVAWAAVPWVLAFAAWSARREMRRPWRQLLIPAVPSRQERRHGDDRASPSAETAPGTGREVAGSSGQERAWAAEAGGDTECQPLLDGMPLWALEGRWRGHAVVLRFRDGRGRLHRLLLWPDVTTPAGRRDLRLALRDRAASPSRGSMAP